MVHERSAFGGRQMYIKDLSAFRLQIIDHRQIRGVPILMFLRPYRSPQESPEAQTHIMGVGSF
jgi:hypothetical protein